MADNFIANPGALGDTFAADDIGGVKFPRSKIVIGADGFNDGDVSAANPLPVTNAALTGALKAEDSVHASGDTGIMALAVRSDAEVPAAANGDYTPLVTNAFGRLKVSAAPADVAVTTGNITASGQTVFVQVVRFSNLSISMVATSLVGHNITFESSNNSTNGTDGNWYVVQVVRSNANTVETTSGVLAATPVYMWQVNVSDYQWFRVRATAHTSGTAAYTFSPSAYVSEPVPAIQVSATQPVSGTVTATGVAGAAAHDAAISGNPVRLAGRALTADYTAVASGDVADLKTTLVGALIQKPFAIPEADWTYAAASGGITNTTGVTVKAAAAAGIRNYVTSISVGNNSAVVTDVQIRDGASGTVLWRGIATANMPQTLITFPNPLRGTAATLVEVACGTTASATYVNLTGYTAP